MVNIAILVISKWTSYCSKCGGRAIVDESHHETVPREGAGCDARFVATTSEYPDYDETCRRLRPDLPFIDYRYASEDSLRLPPGFVPPAA